MSDRDAIVTSAEKGMGGRYVYGAKPIASAPISPSIVSDCSGFSWIVFLKNGLSLPHGTKAQIKQGTLVSADYAKSTKGVLCFELKNSENSESVYHVGISDGQGGVIEAMNAKRGIVKSRITSRFNAFRDVISTARAVEPPQEQAIAEDTNLEDTYTQASDDSADSGSDDNETSEGGIGKLLIIIGVLYFATKKKKGQATS